MHAFVIVSLLLVFIRVKCTGDRRNACASMKLIFKALYLVWAIWLLCH